MDINESRITFRDVKLFAWNIGAAASFIAAICFNSQHNTLESIWWNVMAFGLLMLARTEKDNG